MYSNYIILGKLLNENNFFLKEVEISKTSPTIIKTYGTDCTLPESAHWVQYNTFHRLNPTQYLGYLSHFRNFQSDKRFNNLIQICEVIFNKIFSNKILFNPYNVSLTASCGKVSRHKDEGSRLAAINIGFIENSSAQIHIDNSIGENEIICLDDGYGYLLNTQAYHAVFGNIKKERYVLSYSFSNYTFNELKVLYELARKIHDL